MKILHIIDEMGMGGAQSLLLELVPVQKAMGNKVDILELQAVSDRSLEQKLATLGIQIITLSHKRSVRNPLNIFGIIPYLKQYDIIHVHLFPANYWTAIAKIISLSSTPIITTEHSTYNKRRNIRIFKYIDLFIYRRYQEVIACADKALETFSDRFKGVQCCSIPNGVDISKYINAQPYTKKELLNIGEDCKVVTMVARFKYPKRQDVLINAIAKLSNNFHVVFVGGSENDERLKQMMTLAKKLGLCDQIHFLYVRNDVPRILKSSDVVVMSSDYEGLSLSSVEGMACGRPFVASDVDGLRDVVKDAGLLFENANPDELAELILKLTSDRKYYNEVTQKCLTRAQKFDIYSVAEKYQEEYEKYIK